MNMVSYSFFEPKVLHGHRYWDKFNKIDRYWYNLPALIAVNSLVYPNFKIKFHVSKNIVENKLFVLLEECKDKFKIDLEIIGRDYVNAEPTIWRYKPLLEKECEILLCRDIDSIPTTDEILATYYFITNDKYDVSTIRSHKHHKGPMLAGLCAFRPRNIYLNCNFNTVLDNLGSGWGVDQDFIINTLTRNRRFTKSKFLDSRLNSRNHYIERPVIECDSFDEKYYKDNVNCSVSDDILQLLDLYTKWPGEPVDIRGEKLIKLLNDEVFSDMLSLIENNKILQEFYL
jgi:hypothetical protein